MLPPGPSSSSDGCFLRLVESEVGVSGESIELDNPKQAVGFRPRACRRVILDSYRSRGARATLATRNYRVRARTVMVALSTDSQPIARHQLVSTLKTSFCVCMKTSRTSCQARASTFNVQRCARPQCCHLLPTLIVSSSFNPHIAGLRTVLI